MKRLWAILPLVALIGLVVLFAGFSLNRNPEVTTQALVGQPTPDVTLPRLAGGPPGRMRDAVRVPEGGGPVLVNFFASWCAPCQVEHPTLMALRARGVRIVGVAYKDRPEDSRAFLRRLGDPFSEILVDADGRAAIDFGVNRVPETYLVGPDGVIIAKHSGPLDARSAEALVAQVRTRR